MIKIYICTRETYDGRCERLLYVGLVGCFDTLQKALEAANEEVPCGNELNEDCMSTMFYVNPDGADADEWIEEDGFTIWVTIREIELNHRYKSEGVV